VVLSLDELAALSAAERAELAAAIAQLDARPADPRGRRRRQRFLLLCGLIIVGLASWMVGLGLTLPPRQTVGEWRLVWVGFDLAELAGFALAAWAAWRGRQLLIPAALISGTLLLCDAWFDVVLSWNTAERWQSLVSAVVFEVPLALLLWWVARTLTLQTVRLARTRLGLTGPPPAMRHITLFAGLVELEQSPGARAGRR
jgi:hypothetical protein